MIADSVQMAVELPLSFRSRRTGDALVEVMAQARPTRASLGLDRMLLQPFRDDDRSYPLGRREAANISPKL
jgi:hypothetical protein